MNSSVLRMNVPVTVCRVDRRRHVAPPGGRVAGSRPAPDSTPIPRIQLTTTHRPRRICPSGISRCGRSAGARSRAGTACCATENDPVIAPWDRRRSHRGRCRANRVPDRCSRGGRLAATSRWRAAQAESRARLARARERRGDAPRGGRLGDSRREQLGRAAAQHRGARRECDRRGQRPCGPRAGAGSAWRSDRRRLAHPRARRSAPY